MSVQPRTDHTPETYRCAECDGDRLAHESVEGSFCSTTCYFRKRGRDALRQIKHDHTICTTCFRPIKTVLEPDEHCPECVVGWQFPTEHMTHAIDEFRADRADDWRTDGNSPADRVERTRWSCDCGAVDTGHRYDEIEGVDPAFVMTNAAVLLARLSSEDTIGGSFDADRYKRACRKHWRFTNHAGVYGHDWVDWEYVFGRALYQ